MAKSTFLETGLCNLSCIDEHELVAKLFPADFASLLRCMPPGTLTKAQLAAQLQRFPLQVIELSKKNKKSGEQKPTYACIGFLRLYRSLLALPHYTDLVPIQIYRHLPARKVREHILNDVLVAPQLLAVSPRVYKVLGQAWQEYAASDTLRPLASSYADVLADLLGVDWRCFRKEPR